MCTLVTLCRPGEGWPLLVAANRDERLDRAWDPPGHYWPAQPDILAGRDHAGGGTWMGINRAGVMAAVLNRPGSLGPAPGKRSRGELPLLALAHGTAAAAAAAIAARDGGAYRGFNLIVADRAEAIFLRGDGHGAIAARALSPGLHMVTAMDPDDLASPRTARHLPRFAAAPPPRPEADDWAGWAALLADRSGPAGSELNVPPRGGFGTVCASLVGLSADGAARWLFAPAPADRAAFTRIL
jgi:uncharacterized protein with NRDE domain